MSKLITADCDYICGYLRYGHWELNLTDAEYDDFCNMDESEQERYLMDNGDLIVDDYEVDDLGEPTNIQVHNV